MPKGKVLVLDSDGASLTKMVSYLRSDGYNVQSAQSAQNARTVMAQSRFDVILMELILEDADGLELVEELKSQVSGGIIIVSHVSDTTEKIVSLEVGADDYEL